MACSTRGGKSRWSWRQCCPEWSLAQEVVMFGRKKTDMPEAGSALPGRAQSVEVPPAHFVNGNPLVGPFPEGTEAAVFGMGCFWGAERRFWKMAGVHTTAAGYAGGHTPH